MERLVGNYCIIKYLGRLYTHTSFSLQDLNFYKKQIRENNFLTTIEYDDDLNFFRVIIMEVNNEVSNC